MIAAAGTVAAADTAGAEGLSGDAGRFEVPRASVCSRLFPST